MPDFLGDSFKWLVDHRRLIFSIAAAVAAGGGTAYLISEVLRRLDRGGREPVGSRILGAAILVIVTLAAVTNAAMEVIYPPDASTLPRPLRPADYAYMAALLVLFVGTGIWFERRRRQRTQRIGNPDTSWLIIFSGLLLLATLWLFQRGVERLAYDPDTVTGRELFGTSIGAGLLAMAIIQGLRTLLPLRGLFHRISLERWIDDAMPVSASNYRRNRRIRRAVTRLARGPALADKYSLLDLPIEQLCGQIAAGADRLLDAPFPPTLASTSRHPPAEVADVLVALAGGGAKDIDRYLQLAERIVPPPSAEAVPPVSVPSTPPAKATSDEAQEFMRLRTNISQRIQRHIDGLQIATTYWWRRAVRAVAFSVSGVLGLSVFSGRITYSVMCAIVGGFVATVSRDLVAIVEKARR